ncbi:MAG: phosphodiesterase [Pleomorphochaeta sp.]
MKILIASDIHGSYYWAKKLIDIYEQNDFNKILILGDILYHGPRNDLPKDYNPKKVITLLNNLSSEIIAVRGNCDAEVDQMVLNFEILNESAKLYIDNHLFILAHGHHPYPTLTNNDILLTGHTHIPLYEKLNNNVHHFNPGSVSLAKGGFNNSYMIYENNQFKVVDFDQNIILTKTL